MNQNTHITIVLDRSGSMEVVASDTINGFNRFLKDQQAEPGDCTLTLAQFDDQYEIVRDAQPVSTIQPLTKESFVPRGNTALLGAIGRAIDETGARLRDMPEGSRPSKVVFVIITDGLENASHHTEWAKDKTKDAVLAKVKHQSEQYKWEFVYIGANQDAIMEAQSIGVPQSHALNYASNIIGTQAVYASVSANVRFARRAGGQSVNCMAFSDKQRQEQDEAMQQPPPTSGGAAGPV